MKIENFEAQFRELLARRYRPVAGAMVTYAAVPQAGARHRLVSCRWEFRDESASARPRQDYGALLLGELWLDQSQAADALFELVLQGRFPDEAIAPAQYQPPSGESELEIRVSYSTTGWPEWRFTTRILRSAQRDLENRPIARPGLRPFPSPSAAVMDWLWGGAHGLSWNAPNPSYYESVAILLPDTRARIRDVKRWRRHVRVQVDCAVPDQGFVVQGFGIRQKGRVELPSVAVGSGRAVDWGIPEGMEGGEIFLVNAKDEILGREWLPAAPHDEAESIEPGYGSEAASAGSPLYLRRLLIRNFKNIGEIDLDFTRPSDLGGRWTCIAGINGAGKTAVLQAVCLALLGDRLAPELGSALLDDMRRRGNGERADTTIRVWLGDGNGGQQHELLLPLSQEGIDRSRIEAQPQYREMTQLWQRRGRQVLASYGVSRNLAPLISMLHRNKNIEVQRQMTLFDPMAQVAGIDVLLEKDDRAVAILPVLRKLVEPLFKGESISLAASSDELTFNMGGAQVSAVELPDGYRSSIAWLADLCAAWYEKQPDVLARGDLAALHGIVLVDEIDLHLHPHLQRTLVPVLRKMLPRVQWIVTTHSPLVLSSFDKNELVLLDAESPDGVRSLDRQIRGFTMDEIYEWLMHTPARSVEVDRASREVGSDDAAARERLALLLSQSPDVSEEEARETLEYRRRLAEKLGVAPSTTEPGK